MSTKQYLNAFINNSATIRNVLAADIEDAPHKAVAYDSDGKLALPAADGAPAVGVILSDAAAFDTGSALVTKAGTEVDVLIKDTGLIETGEAVAKGDLLTVDAKGCAKKAAAGSFILGIAMTAAAVAGELVQIHITKSGYAV
ncbi:MAG: DUF2190 family protein [Oscillospiraceae bacterium]|nr:DUF2190 family protein [Oscillospiraceae bacterium]